MKNLQLNTEFKNLKIGQPKSNLSIATNNTNSTRQNSVMQTLDAARAQLPSKITVDGTNRTAISQATEYEPNTGYQVFITQEETYVATCKVVYHLIERKINTLKVRLKKQSQQLNLKLKSIDIAKTKPEYIFENTFKRNREQEYLSNKAKYDIDAIAVTDEKAIQEKRVKDLNKNIAFITIKTGTPVKRLYDKNFGYYAALLLLSMLEIPLNFLALQTLGLFNNLNAMVISVGLGFVSILLAHISGASLQKNRWLLFWIAATASGLLFTVIVYLRFEEGVIISLLPITLWLGGFLLAYLRSINSVYFLLIKDLDKVQKNLRKLKQKEKEIDNKILKANRAVDQRFEQEAKELSNDSQHQEIAERINHLKAEVAELDAIKEERLELVSDFFIERVLLYRNAVNVQLSNRGLLPIIWKNPPSLHSVPEIVTMPKPSASSSGTDNPFKVRGSGGITNMIVLLMLCLFGFSSCMPDQVTQTEGIVSIDLTDANLLEHVQSADYVTEYISDYFFEFDGTASPDFGIVTVSSIEETSLSKTKSIELGKGEHYLFRNEKERKNAIKKVKKQIAGAINSTLQQQSEHHNTQLYRHLCSCTKRFKKSTADQHFIMLFSDMIEFTSSKANFYKYKKQPEKLLEDYEEIVQIMQSDCTVDLKGVEVIVVQLPNSHDELVNVSRKFWEKFFRDQQVRDVTFVANL